MVVIVKPLTPDLIEDFLHFFDDIAFSDNPEWGGCYCHFYHFAGDIEQWKETTKEQNRNATITLIKEEKMKGFLAFVDNEPAGWCNVNSKDAYKKTPIDGEPEDTLEGKIASIVCFFNSSCSQKKGDCPKTIKARNQSFKGRGFCLD